MENQKKKKKGWLFLMNFLQWCLSFWFFFFYFLNAKRKGDTWICENNVQKLKLEKDPNALGKAKSSQRDSIAMLAREH